MSRSNSRNEARKLVSSIVPRKERSYDELPFVSTPKRTLVMPEPVDRSEGTTVVEPEEWVRARDQIAVLVRSTVAEALVPLQAAIATLIEQSAALARRLDEVSGARPGLGTLPPPPRAPEMTIPPPPPSYRSTSSAPPSSRSMPSAPPSSDSSSNCLAKFGGLAKKLRDEKGLDVSAIDLAAQLLERIAARVDERAAEELTMDILQHRYAEDGSQ